MMDHYTVLCAEARRQVTSCICVTDAEIRRIAAECHIHPATVRNMLATKPDPDRELRIRGL